MAGFGAGLLPLSAVCLFIEGNRATMIAKTPPFNLAERLGRLFPKGGGAPLASVKTAAAWLDGLPTGDAMRAQQMVYEEFRRLLENPTECTKSRLDAILLADARSRDLQDALARQYLRNPRMSRAVESQLWHAIYNYYREIARLYHTYLAELANKSVLASETRALLIQRTLRNFRHFMKWRFVRYMHLEAKTWQRVHNLYKLAEDSGIQHQPQKTYPHETGAHTCESEYLQCLMLNQANAGTLYPRQIDLVDLWLDGWVRTLHLDKQLDAARQVFNVNLAEDHGARRIRRVTEDSANRYWSTRELVERLARIRDDLQESVPPARLGLGSEARMPETRDIIEHLERQWSPLATRDQRRKSRQAVKKSMEVVYGLEHIIAALKDKPAEAAEEATLYGDHYAYDESVDMHVYGFVTSRTRERRTQIPGAAGAPPGYPMESWVMEDESECGYGACVSLQSHDWLRVGALVALRAPRSDAWKLGVVRRLSRVVGDADNCSVGIETLPEIPDVLSLHTPGNGGGYYVNGVDATNTLLPAVVIRLTNPAGGRACVLIDPGQYQPQRVVEIRGLNRLQRVRFGAPAERGEGWLRLCLEELK